MTPETIKLIETLAGWAFAAFVMYLFFRNGTDE
jgi:hypothetical protein